MKKLIIISIISSSLFIFGCKQVSEITNTINTWEVSWNNIENNTWNINTWDTTITTWIVENDTTWVTSWDIKTLIDEYKINNTWNSGEFNENDVDLAEKIIEAIDKK